jgi:hypothetical protein
MHAATFHRNDEGGAVDDTRLLTGEELDRRVRAGWEEWCELLEGLLGTGGMLPSRELAGWVVAFFEDAYWRTEEARVEALRRRLAAECLRRRDGLDRAWGIG